MEKKNRPLQAANSDIRTSDITPTTSPVQVPRRTPKKHRARVYMLRTGVIEMTTRRKALGLICTDYAQCWDISEKLRGR